MPLLKKPAIPEQGNETPMETPSSTDCQPTQAPEALEAKTKPFTRKSAAHLTKEEYWDRKEARDIQRDKDMAWSGLAQAALSSVGVIQLNADNTEDSLVGLVVRITDKLLKARDSR